MELAEWQPQFNELGISVAAITYDPPAQLSRFTRKHKLQYPLLSDAGSEAINQLGLLNTDMEPGTRFYGVPYPGVLLLDANGRIRGKFAEMDYRDRPLFDDMLNAAREMIGP